MTDDVGLRPADPVVPETKDWTWVLERPCPECGLVSTEVTVDRIRTMVRTYGSRWALVFRRPDAGVIADMFAFVQGEQWARSGPCSNGSVFTVATLA